MLTGDFHFSPKYQYIYIATRKVACSTIKHMLQTAEIGDDGYSDRVTSGNQYGYSDFLLNIHDARNWQLAHPTNETERRSMADQARLTFCFVRNPYSRVLSAYLDKIHSNGNRRKAFLAPFFNDEERAAMPISFVEFLKLVAGQEADVMDGHWRPQYHHLKSFNLNYNMVGSFEKLNADLDVVIKKIDGAILHYKSDILEHSTGSSKKIDFYSDDAIDLVKMIYRDDFDRLGYTMEITNVGEPSTLPLTGGLTF